MVSDVIFDNLYLDRCLRFGRYLDVIMFFLLGDTLLMFGSNSIVDMEDWDYTFNVDDSMLFDFPIYRTSDVILGHISFLVEIYRSSWIHMILITYEMHVKLMVHCYFIMIP